MTVIRARLWFAAAVAVLVCCAAAVAATTGPGSVDLSFGDHGTVVAGGNDAPYDDPDLAVQPDGKIVMVAFALPRVSPADNGYLLTRYNADGTLDTTFGVGGSVISSAGTNPVVALAPDGGILVSSNAGAAAAVFEPKAGGLIERYRPDGTLDTSFGTAGSVKIPTTDTLSSDTPPVAVQNDGSVLVLSRDQLGLGVQRLSPSGQPDQSFGGSGHVRLFVGRQDLFDEPRAIAIDSSDRIVIAGVITGDGDRGSVVIRLTPAGGLDRTFSDDGHVVLSSLSISSLLVQPSGAIVVGTSSVNITGRGRRDPRSLVRFRASGALDPAFSRPNVKQGICSVVPDALAQQSDGKIIAAGFDGIARYTATGAVDRTFGHKGLVSFGETPCATARGLLAKTMVQSVAVEPGYGIVAAGPLEPDPTRLLLTRLLSGT
jgi:uncharacterized delta-60 repeat protein